MTRAARAGLDRAARDEAALLLGVSPATRWRMGDPAGALAGLRLGLALALLHGLTSLAAPLVFPGAASLSLPVLLLEGSELRGLTGLAAALPLAVTLPLLAIALSAARGSPVVGDEITGATRRPEDGTLAALGFAVVIAWVALPLVAVLLTGVAPESIAALVLDTRAGSLAALLAGSALLALAACAGAGLALAYVPPAVPALLRTGAPPWLALAVPPISLATVLAAASSAAGGPTGVLAMHALLGYGAALPAVAAYSRSAAPPVLDATRALGASTLQSVWWMDRERASRALVGAMTLAGLASLGDVTMLALDPIAATRTLGPATVVLLEHGATSGAAFVLASVLTVAGVGSLFALMHTGAGALAIWSRR